MMMLAPSYVRRNFVDDMFDNFFNDRFSRPTRPAFAPMKTDVKETDTGYEIDMELPGFAKEDVKAQLKDGYLTVTAEHTENKEEKDENSRYLRRERYTGRYQRTFYVGEDVTEEDIKAGFQDGVLNITVPKKEALPQQEVEKYITIE